MTNDISNKVMGSQKSGENAMGGLSSGQSNSPRILARQLARPLTGKEIDFVAGGARARASGTCSAGTSCTPDCDD